MGRSEGEPVRREEPQRPSRKLFPVGKEAIDTAKFLVIPSSRSTTTDIEKDYITKHNEELYLVLRKFLDRYTDKVDAKYRKFYENPFMDGAMFVHFVLRLHAEDELPAFLQEGQRDDVESIFHHEMTEIKYFADERSIPEEELDTIAQIRISTLASTNNDERLLGQTLIDQSETFNDTRDGDTFLVGAMFAYDAIKRRYEETEQEKFDFALRQLKQGEENIATQAADTELDHWTQTHPELADLDELFTSIIDVEVPNDNSAQTTANGLADEIEIFLRERGSNGQQDAA